MRLKIQVDAKRNPDERNSYLGIIIIMVENRPFAGIFDFQMEMFDGGGGAMPFVKIKQNNQLVFRPATLAGTKGILQKICREAIELAVDLMEDVGLNSSTYAGDFPVDNGDAAEIKKFLRDTSGDPVN